MKGEEVDLILKEVWRISLGVFLRIVEIKKGKKKVRKGLRMMGRILKGGKRRIEI